MVFLKHRRDHVPLLLQILPLGDTVFLPQTSNTQKDGAYPVLENSVGTQFTAPTVDDAAHSCRTLGD